MHIVMPGCGNNDFRSVDPIGTKCIGIASITNTAVPIFHVSVMLAGGRLTYIIEGGVLMLCNNVCMGSTNPFGIGCYKPYLLTLHLLCQIKCFFGSILRNSNAVNIPLELQLFHTCLVLVERHGTQISFQVISNRRYTVDRDLPNAVFIVDNRRIGRGCLCVYSSQLIRNAITVGIPTTNNQTAVYTVRRYKKCALGNGLCNLMRSRNDPCDLISCGDDDFFINGGIGYVSSNRHRVRIGQQIFIRTVPTQETVTVTLGSHTRELRNKKIASLFHNRLEYNALIIINKRNLTRDHSNGQRYTSNPNIVCIDLNGIIASCKLIQLLGMQRDGLQYAVLLINGVEAIQQRFSIQGYCYIPLNRISFFDGRNYNVGCFFFPIVFLEGVGICLQ